jgi:hypothetical protein
VDRRIESGACHASDGRDERRHEPLSRGRKKHRMIATPRNAKMRLNQKNAAMIAATRAT